MSMDGLKRALGLSDIHMAVFEGDLKMIKQLLRRGDDPDAQAKTNKMTALHFAVILRKFDIACLLIRKGASSSARDAKGRSPGKYNAKKIRMRYLRWFKKGGYQHEESIITKSTKLSKLLRYPVTMRSLGRTEHPLSKSLMYPDGKNLVILKRVLTIPLPKAVDDSTYGHIAGPEDEIPRALAISGWENESTDLSSGVLPNGRLTQLVCDAATYLGFRLPIQGFLGTGRGQNLTVEDSGRHLASHVEKQLGLYWVLILLKKYCATNKVDRLGELKRVQLKEEESSPWIFLNHEPCSNCLGFLIRLEETTGVRFTFETVPAVVKRQRRSARGCPNCSCGSSAGEQPISQVTATREDTPIEDEVTREELEPIRNALLRTPTRPPGSVAALARATITEAPSPWDKRGIAVDGKPNAKPVAKKVSETEFYGATSSASSSGAIPASTIAGGAGNCSAYFESPTPTQGWHVPEAVKNRPRGPAEAAPLDTERATIQKSKAKLNLAQFRYTSTPSAISPARIVKKGNRGRPMGSKNKKPSRATLRKQVAMKERSTFAHALRFHQRNSRL